MEYMKAIAVMGPNDIRVVDDVPKPVLGDYEALVKVHACGFCNGTDMQIITGTGGDLGNSVSIYPTVLGHEGAGEVVAVGKKVRHIHVGERWLHPNLYPDVGNGYTKTHGSMAEYGMVSDNQAMLEDGFAEKDFPWVKQHKFPNTMSYIDAGVLLSLAESHSAAKNFGVTEGTEILTYGHGAVPVLWPAGRPCHADRQDPRAAGDVQAYCKNGAHHQLLRGGCGRGAERQEV